MNGFYWFITGVLLGPAFKILIKIALKILTNAWKESRK